MNPVLLVLIFFQLVSQIAAGGSDTRYCDPSGSNCPFNDLTPSEIKSAIQVIRAFKQFSGDIQFPIVRTQEPSKASWTDGSAHLQPRIAYAAVFDSFSNLLSEVLVDLRQNSILSVLPLPSILPPLTAKEDRDARRIFRDDRRVQEAYASRGLNFSYVDCETWVVGAVGPAGNPPGKRLVKLMAAYQEPSLPYRDWHPVEGLEVAIDLNRGVVDTFLDFGPIPSPPTIKFGPALRSLERLKPLTITQPAGSSIQVRGQQLEWYKWKFIYSMDIIHGLQLFHVRYWSDCQERLVLYKASISEMFVPYGAWGRDWRWRNAFDAGEYGLGRWSSEMILGQDVPENALLFNCTIPDDDGAEPKILSGCVGVYERDGGLLYKHTDFDRRRTDGARGRELVLTFVAAIGNYDYAFEYIFLMDGTVHFNVRLTGIVLPRGVTSAQNDATCIESCSTLVNHYLIAPVHQHFFNFRLDLDVDGQLNYVTEVEVRNDDLEVGDPDFGAFSVRREILKLESYRDHNLESSRSWHVVNANSRNRFGSPRGYAIKPDSIGYSMQTQGNPLLEQAEFVAHAFWATSYNDTEQGAAGAFPRTGKPHQGLPDFIRNAESLENSDVVVWYTLGVTHTTRPEEWPIMNAHSAGFHLIPYNFMSQNSETPLEGSCV